MSMKCFIFIRTKLYLCKILLSSRDTVFPVSIYSKYWVNLTNSCTNLSTLIITRIIMFVQRTRTQDMYDIYLACLYRQRIAVVITWHSDPASFYSECWMNLTVRSTNISSLIITCPLLGRDRLSTCLPIRRPGSIPRGVRNINFYPGTGYVFFVYVLSSVVSGGSSDIVLTTHSGRFALV